MTVLARTLNLDREVAEKVFGAELPPPSPIMTPQTAYLRAFSGNATEAWLVVDHMVADEWTFKAESIVRDGKVEWDIRFNGYTDKHFAYSGQATDINLPTAICRAALSALLVELDMPRDH